MFDLSSFIVKNTVDGVKNGTFTKEYVNIMAVNYMLKGALAEEDVIAVNTKIEAWEAEQETQKAENESVSDIGEEIIVEDETTVESGENEAVDGLLGEEDEGEPLV